MSILKKYLICILIIILCFSYITPIGFAQNQTVIITQPEQANVILILNYDGTVKERIYFQNNNYSNIANEEEPIEPVDNNNKETNETIEPTIDTPAVINDLANEIFELINKERTAAGLSKLEYNFELQSGADIRAKEASESFSHTRPSGETCYTAFNVNYNVAGENLIMADKQIATAENLVKTWMESEGHKANILLPEFTSTAIGVYGEDVIYVAQLFIG